MKVCITLISQPCEVKLNFMSIISSHQVNHQTNLDCHPWSKGQFDAILRNVEKCRRLQFEWLMIRMQFDIKPSNYLEQFHFEIKHCKINTTAHPWTIAERPDKLKFN